MNAYRLLKPLTFTGVGIFGGKQHSVCMMGLNDQQASSLRLLLKNHIEKNVPLHSGFNSRDVYFYPMPSPERFFNHNSDRVIEKITDHPQFLLGADLECVSDTHLRTTALGRSGDNPVRISTVEHILSSISQENIEKVLILVSSDEENRAEIPLLDGSAKPFSNAFKSAEKEIIESGLLPLAITDSFQFSHDNDSSLYLFIPGEQQLEYSAFIDYTSEPLIGLQSYSFTEDITKYRSQIAPARTFCLKEELDFLLEKGLIKAGGYENGLVIDKEKVLGSEGLRFDNEMVRHKLLDLIGDFSLVNYTLQGHIVALKPSHSGNIAFAKALLQEFL